MNENMKLEFPFTDNSGELSGDELVEHLKNDNNTEENKRYRIRSGYILREIAGEYAIIPVDEESLITNAVMAPNDTAVFLWKAFLYPSTIEDVVKKGMQEYDATEETIRNATYRFVEETLRYRILEEVV